MHEVHLVRSLLEAAEKEALAKKAKKVKCLRIQFNSLTSHSGDHVRFSFDLVKKEIPLFQDALLELKEVEPDLLCSGCGHKFHGDHLPDICPRCSSWNVKALHPTDMILESIEMEC